MNFNSRTCSCPLSTHDLHCSLHPLNREARRLAEIDAEIASLREQWGVIDSRVSEEGRRRTRELRSSKRHGATPMNYAWSNPETGVREQADTPEEARYRVWEELQPHEETTMTAKAARV